MSNQPIILVEKNDEIIAFIKDTLAGLPNPVQAFCSEEQALAHMNATKGEQTPCLVLLSQDSCAPDALGFLKQIRADNHTRFLPVVLLCPEMPLPHVLECYAAGANSVICKPFDQEEFRDLVKLLGVYWTTAVRTPGPASSPAQGTL